MLRPTVVPAQLLTNLGNFAFTGSHAPLRTPVFREWLPGDGLKIGSAQVHPFLGFSEVYTDNAFRSNKRRRSDLLSVIAPGIQVNQPFGGKHSFLLDYRLTQFLYKEFSENNALVQHGVGHFKFDFSSGLTLDLQGGHVEGFNTRGSIEDTQQNQLTKWATNTFLSQAEYLGRYAGVRLRFSYVDLHFRNNDQATARDRNSIRTQLTFFMPTKFNVSGLFGFNMTNRTFDENKQLDSFSYGFFTGVRMRASRMLSGEVQLGYQILSFDRAAVEDPAQILELEERGLSQGGSRQKRFVMRGNLVWAPNVLWTMNLQAVRQIRQLGVFNTSTVTQTGTSLTVRRVLYDRLFINGIFSYFDFSFDNGRRDDAFRWSASVDYKTVEWLGFRLGYIFEKRASNQPLFDFYSNSFMVSVQCLF